MYKRQRETMRVGQDCCPSSWAVKGDADMDMRTAQCRLPPPRAALGLLPSPTLSAVLPTRSLPKLKTYCHKILPNKSALIKSACNLVVETILSPPSYCGFPKYASWGWSLCDCGWFHIQMEKKTHKSRGVY